MSILKLEHSFSKEIKESLLDSCKDGEVQHSVNFICKDGVVSCDHTIVASLGKQWKTILMSTKQDTNYVIAPEYSVKYMKNYLHSSILGYDITRTDDSRILENEQKIEGSKNKLENGYKIKGPKNMLENKPKNQGQQINLENKSDKDDVDTSTAEVFCILNEFVEKLIDICVEDDKQFRYKDDKDDDYNVRYYFDYDKRKDCPYKISDNQVRYEGLRRKVKKVTQEYKSELSLDNFKVMDKTTCNICLKSFSYPAHCKEHMNSMHSKDPKYQCDKCNTKFRTAKGLKAHLESSHENESKDPFICSTCGRVFLYKRSLDRHCKAEQHSYLKICSKTKKLKFGEEKGVKCTICHKIIASHYLELHMKKNHTDEAREFKCDYCDYKTKRRDSLRRHKREVHFRFQSELSAVSETFKEGTSTYLCPDCKKILRTVKEVENHVVGKICSMTCNICEKTFSRKHNLRQHMRKFHPNTEH